MNIKLHSEEYINMFNSIMMVDPCSVLRNVVSVNDCDTFADGSLEQVKDTAYFFQTNLFNSGIIGCSNKTFRKYPKYVESLSKI